MFSNFVLLGDFNVNYFCTQNPLFSRLNSVTLSFNLTQLVAEPTQVCDTSCTLIDLIFVSTTTKVNSCNTIPPLSNSDHFGLQLNISTINPRRQRKIHPRLVWRYSLADFESITNMLDDADLEELLDDDVNSSWIKWKNSFLLIMRNCIPQIAIQSENRVPWVTHEIKQAMRKRKLLLKKARSSGDPQDFMTYKQQRNHTLDRLRESRQSFFSKFGTANSKEFWKAIKVLGVRSTTFPSISDSNSRTHADTAEDKACLLNNFFYSCFNRSCPPLTLNSSEIHLQTNLDSANFPESLKCTSVWSVICAKFQLWFTEFSPCNSVLAIPSLLCSPCNSVLAIQSLLCSPCNSVLAIQSLQFSPCAMQSLQCNSVLAIPMILTIQAMF